MSTSCKMTRGVGDMWASSPALLQGVWARLSKWAEFRSWNWLSAYYILYFPCCWDGWLPTVRHRLDTVANAAVGSTNGTRWKELLFRVLGKSPMQMVLLNVKISRNPNGLFVCLQGHSSKSLHNSICLLNLVENSNIFQNIWFLLKLVDVPTLCHLSRVVLYHHNTLVGTVCLKPGFSTFFPVSTPESYNQCLINPTLLHPQNAYRGPTNGDLQKTDLLCCISRANGLQDKLS